MIVFSAYGCNDNNVSTAIGRGGHIMCASLEPTKKKTKLKNLISSSSLSVFLFDQHTYVERIIFKKIYSHLATVSCTHFMAIKLYGDCFIIAEHFRMIQNIDEIITNILKFSGIASADFSKIFCFWSARMATDLSSRLRQRLSRSAG